MEIGTSKPTLWSTQTVSELVLAIPVMFVLKWKIKPDILLLDLAMPKKDGLTVVREVIENDSNAKIILITASDNQKVIHDCLNAGAIAYISKPFDFDNVLKIISNTISWPHCI